MGMRFRMGPGFKGFPEALFAIGPGRPGWSGGFGPFDVEFGPGPGPGRHGRRGRGRRMFDSGELRLVLLKLIADQPRHGYDLIRAIEELTHGAYAPSPGVIYPTLTLLQDMDLIEEQEAEGQRKAYRATAAGAAHLEERDEEVRSLFDRLAGLGEDRKKAGGAPIKRAVGNLLAALWHRVTRDDVNEETLHDIAAILDEAARKIERMK